MTKLTQKNLIELRNLLDAANPIPWSVEISDPYMDGRFAVRFRRYGLAGVIFTATAFAPDAELVTAAVNTLPSLLDAAVELEEVEKKLEDHRYITMRMAEQLTRMTAERDALASKIQKVKNLAAMIDRSIISVPIHKTATEEWFYVVEKIYKILDENEESV